MVFVPGCIDSDPLKRATVQELLENDFFDDRELNVLLVGRDGNELKLRFARTSLSISFLRLLRVK